MAKEPVVLEQRPLGRTGRATAILSLSTRRLADAGQKEAVRVVQEAIDHGVNLIELGWEFGDGRMSGGLGLRSRTATGSG